jgi:hypothetical protein
MKKMFERERLDEQQLALYEAGLMTLQFYYPEGFDQRACLKRIEDYMPEEPEPEPEPSDSDEDSDDD